MKISFRQSGGISGQIRGCEIDVDALGEKESGELKDLIRLAGIDQSFKLRDDRARDAEFYELGMESGGHQIHASFDEASMTAAYAPLVEFLQGRAAPRELRDDDDTPPASAAATRILTVFFDIGDTLARAHLSGGSLRLVPIQGVVELLAEFRESGSPLGLLSNTPRGFSKEQMDTILEEVGLLSFFEDDLRIYSSVVNLDKSSVEIFNLAATRAGLANSPDRVLFVGEDADERAVAERAGWNSTANLAAGLRFVRDR